MKRKLTVELARTLPRGTMLKQIGYVAYGEDPICEFIKMTPHGTILHVHRGKKKQMRANARHFVVVDGKVNNYILGGE